MTLQRTDDVAADWQKLAEIDVCELAMRFLKTHLDVRGVSLTRMERGWNSFTKQWEINVTCADEPIPLSDIPNEWCCHKVFAVMKPRRVKP